MKKQLLGIAIILFSILLSMIGANNGFWIPIIDTLPWNMLSFITGIIGLIIVIKNSNQSP